MSEVELALDARAELGECPRWHARQRALYFVDILAQTLSRFDPATGERRTRRFDAPIGCFVFQGDTGLVLAMADGFYRLAGFDAELRPLGAAVETGCAHTRFNDGRADARGRFWAGTVDATRSRADAVLYRLQAGGGIEPVVSGLTTTNGVAFSPDGRTLYYADTPHHSIYACDLDLEDGRVGERRVFHQFPHGAGRPDGASVDELGYYWTALYAGARVVRLSPAGEIVQEVAIPARNPTMIAFGGGDRRTAYVTTARANTSDEDLLHFPYAGGLFAFRVDVPGLAEHDFAG